MAEDIEEKIRRLRELGKVSVEEKGGAKAPSARPSAPARKPSKLGRLRERERRRRIIIGASILAIIIIAVVVGVYITTRTERQNNLRKPNLQRLQRLTSTLLGSFKMIL